jgi:hypothetical protein
LYLSMMCSAHVWTQSVVYIFGYKAWHIHLNMKHSVCDWMYIVYYVWLNGVYWTIEHSTCNVKKMRFFHWHCLQNKSYVVVQFLFYWKCIEVTNRIISFTAFTFNGLRSLWPQYSLDLSRVYPQRFCPYICMFAGFI